MDQNQEPRPSLREVIAQGFARTDDGMEDQQAQAEQAAALAPDASDPNAAMQQAAPDAAQTAQEAPQAAQGAPILPGIDNTAETIPAGTQAQAQPQQDGNAQMIRFLMAQLQQSQAQNQALSAQLQQAQGTMQQQSEAAQTAIDSTMTQPSVTIPVLDFTEMQYDDDATRTQKMQDWQNAIVRSITDSVAAQYASQLAPIREDYEAKQRIASTNAAKSTLYGDPRFSDFKDRDAMIEKIVAAPEFANMDADKRYLYGGLMARGLDYKPQPSAEEIVKMVKANPDAQRLLDTERARAIADRNGQIPTVMPSSGLGSANAIPENKPTTRDDLRRRIADAFR